MRDKQSAASWRCRHGWHAWEEWIQVTTRILPLWGFPGFMKWRDRQFFQKCARCGVEQ